MVARVDMPAFWAETPDFLTSWGWQSGWFYFTPRPGTDPAAIQAQMAWERRNIPDEQFGNQTFNQGDEQDFRLANISDIHLGEAQEATMSPGNDRSTIVTFTIIAFLILGMACINFTNLATARASQRAREVALRKVLGANRQQLITQFLAESVLIAASRWCRRSPSSRCCCRRRPFPRCRSRHDLFRHRRHAAADRRADPDRRRGGGDLSGLLPEQVPAGAGAQGEQVDRGGHRLRPASNFLVVGQFAISIGLIICTAVVYAQTVYARTTDPGYRRDGLIQVENPGRQLVERSNAITDQIERARRRLGRALGHRRRHAEQLQHRCPGAGAEPVTIGNYGIDPQFFDDGHRARRRPPVRREPPGRPSRPTPSTRRPNRSGARRARSQYRHQRAGGAPDGLPQPGRRGRQDGRCHAHRPGEWRCCAVADHRRRPRSAVPHDRQPIDPILFIWNTEFAGTLLVRHDGRDPQGVRARVEQAQRLAPDVPFDGEFSEDRVAELYDAEESRARCLPASPFSP